MRSAALVAVAFIDGRRPSDSSPCRKVACWSLFDDFGHRFTTIVVCRCFGPVRCPTDAVFDHQSHFGRRVSHFYSKPVIAEQNAADRLAADYRPDADVPFGGGLGSSLTCVVCRWLLRLASMDGSVGLSDAVSVFARVVGGGCVGFQAWSADVWCGWRRWLVCVSRYATVR